jgi:hypothetical protein
MSVPFRVGDIVIYNPPYPVDGKWLQFKENKKEFTVVRGDDMVDSSGDPYTTIVIADMEFVGMDRNEIPYGHSYQIGSKSFYHLVQQQPAWEV